MHIERKEYRNKRDCSDNIAYTVETEDDILTITVHLTRAIPDSDRPAVYLILTPTNKILVTSTKSSFPPEYSELILDTFQDNKIFKVTTIIISKHRDIPASLNALEYLSSCQDMHGRIIINKTVIFCDEIEVVGKDLRASHKGHPAALVPVSQITSVEIRPKYPKNFVITAK